VDQIELWNYVKKMEENMEKMAEAHERRTAELTEEIAALRRELGR
jgi:hypothetical protein